MPGLSNTGFMADVGLTPAAVAWRYWARPISEPSAHTIELFDMFWALKGTTSTPRRRATRHKAVTTRDLPASDDVPATRIPVMVSLLVINALCCTAEDRAESGRRRTAHGPHWPALRQHTRWLPW